MCPWRGMLTCRVAVETLVVLDDRAAGKPGRRFNHRRQPGDSGDGIRATQKHGRNAAASWAHPEATGQPGADACLNARPSQFPLPMPPGSRAVSCPQALPSNLKRKKIRLFSLPPRARVPQGYRAVSCLKCVHVYMLSATNRGTILWGVSAPGPASSTPVPPGHECRNPGAFMPSHHLLNSRRNSLSLSV